MGRVSVARVSEIRCRSQKQHCCPCRSSIFSRTDLTKRQQISNTTKITVRIPRQSVRTHLSPRQDPRREWSQCPARLAAAQRSPRAPRPWLWVCLRSHGTAQNRLLLIAQDSEPGQEGERWFSRVGGTTHGPARAREHELGRGKDPVALSRSP